jgi:peptidoglycan/LPS O-acetylase OafA/YrhL
LTYRPDIDGLRAIAVFAVIVFHAFPSVAPGGFVGVDIFFVISGFLITGLLASEMRAGRFSIATFYARRVRRIFPALIVVLAFTFAVGWVLLFPEELKHLGRDISTSAGFVANLSLWSETGYFDRAVETKPLLHLWSLGVEEQFYIVWPLVLALVLRSHARLRVVASVILLASLVANLALVGRHPSAAFFSPFTRFWQLMVGALLALRRSGSAIDSAQLRQLLSLVGTALCLGSIFLLSQHVAYPGWPALLPTVGACLLIAAGASGIVNRAVLAQPAMVGLGKISYPLYLWHWPLLTFGRILVGGPLTLRARAALMIVSVLLAWVTYAVVETPVRRSPARLRIVAIPCGLLLALGVAAGAVYALGIKGTGQPYSTVADPATVTSGAGKELVANGCGLSPAEQDLILCISDIRETPVFAMLGDSKAGALIWGAFRESTPGRRWKLLQHAQCAPTTGVVRISPYAEDDPDQCARANELALRLVTSDPHIKLVTLVTARRIVIGPDYAKVGSRVPYADGVLDGLDGTVSALTRAGKKVALVIDNPTLPDPPLCLDRSVVKYPLVRKLAELSGATKPACTITYAEYLESAKDYLSVIGKLRARHPELIVYDPAPLLCDLGKGICSISKDGNFLYGYTDHISDAANAMIAKQLLPQLEAAIAVPHDAAEPNKGRGLLSLPSRPLRSGGGD